MRNGASAARDKRSIETSNGPLTREQPRLHVFDRENERGEERENKIVLWIRIEEVENTLCFLLFLSELDRNESFLRVEMQSFFRNSNVTDHKNSNSIKSD